MTIELLALLIAASTVGWLLTSAVQARRIGKLSKQIAAVLSLARETQQTQVNDYLAINAAIGRLVEARPKRDDKGRFIKP